MQETSSLSQTDFEGSPRKGSGLVLEIFAGSCRFSKACKKIGLRVLTIDKDPKRAQNFPVASYDLTGKQDFQSVCKFVEAEKDNIVLPHCAPSYGTVSKAKEKCIPGVFNPPRPLRSDSYPDGLPGLTERGESRVNEANLSYAAMVELVSLLSVENPLNSLFWLTSLVVKLCARFPGHFTVLQHCMHGGTRDKKSKFGHTILGNRMSISWPLWASCVTDRTNMNPGNPAGSRVSFSFRQRPKLHIHKFCVNA
jgi:hypothetical protein